ncbi:MAG: hypothetical protein AAFV36_01370 [Myxococcota bacterium]
MKKTLFAICVPCLVACGEGETLEPSLAALQITGPLFEEPSTDPECAMNQEAAAVLSDEVLPIRDRLGAPSELLDELANTTGVEVGADRVEWLLSDGERSLVMTRVDEGTRYRVTIDYRESSVAGEFRWAEGQLELDERAGTWTVSSWNGQPVMDVDWTSDGDALDVNHYLVGSEHRANRVVSDAVERLTVQRGPDVTAVARWDWELANGSLETDQSTVCLTETVGSVCQQSCAQ